MNRLADSTSPYLLQHKDNPVDWWPWCDDAFAEAQRLDRPVLLSIGYAACHWCHVMAHESFEDPTIAAYLNEHFVAIKVDREERPDVDAVYMAATQALTGAGGWPMTVFATPDGQPFYAGTYFPPEPRHGLPSFPQLLHALREAWRGERGNVLDAASRIAKALGERTVPGGGDGPLARDSVETLLAGAVEELAGGYDSVRGGFGSAPKFPPSMVLEYLLRHHARTGDARRACDGRGHSGGDGTRRDVRPARRRLRALLGRCGLGGPALREDAVRQCVAAPGVCALVAGDGGTTRRARRPRDGATSC